MRSKLFKVHVQVDVQVHVQVGFVGILLVLVKVVFVGFQVCVDMKVGEKIDEQKSQQLGLSFVDLPLDIMTHILIRLPIKSILVCKFICKSFNSVISDPHFSKLHFKHAPSGFMIRTSDPNRLSRFVHLLEYEPEKFNNNDIQCCYCEDDFIKQECYNHVKLEPKFKLPVHGGNLILDKINGLNSDVRKRSYAEHESKYDRFMVVNSCNGFLCLCDRVKNYFVVCNPVTSEFIRLPEATKMDKNKFWHQVVYPGFGFNPKTNEYKIVRVLKRHKNWWDRKGTMTVDMFTLGTSKWRNVEVHLQHIFNVEVNHQHIFKLLFPTCTNGALHWICSHDNKGSLLCFKFKKERFHSFPSPPGVFIEGKYGTNNVSMGNLGGFLYICDSSSLDTPVTMWIMKKYGIGESWTKVFSIDALNKKCWPYGGLYWPVKNFNDGAAMLMCHSSRVFIYYEPKKCVFKLFKVRGTQSNRLEVIPHIPTFISLKTVVNGNNIRLLDANSRSTKFKLAEENEALFLAKVIVEVNVEVDEE
ncbi:F-box protein At3g07870-like [Lotus japonicus]|uniref:F-box protein At3g07870-like n=1 Tax=Lotus japonicus TaxID=34305 RepID=UPI002584DF58|nr:F-box protein At3g07870-like [Lotus japonicus]